MIDYLGLIDKYYAQAPELRHILVTHSRQVADRPGIDRILIGTDRRCNVASRSGLQCLRDGFASVGGENMQPASYWSSTPASSFVADYYSFISGSWGNDGEMDNSDNYRVRACLAF